MKLCPSYGFVSLWGDYLLKARQEVAELLNEAEELVEYTNRKPRLLTALVFIMIGAWAVIESVVYRFAPDAMFFVFLAGLLLLYAAAWILRFSGREYVCVTNERVLYRKINLFGKPGRVMSYPLRDISKASLCRTFVNFQQKTQYGHVLLILGNRKRYVLPYLQSGMFVVEAIRDECGKIAMSLKEEKGDCL